MFKHVVSINSLSGFSLMMFKCIIFINNLPRVQCDGKPSDELLSPGKTQNLIVWGGVEIRTRIPCITPTIILIREICFVSTRTCGKHKLSG